MPLILVSNDRTVRSQYDFWEDDIYNQYHFPNQYKNKLVPGTKFIYYKGIRRAKGRRETPIYFGQGEIGISWRDENIPITKPKIEWRWYCALINVELFPNEVPFHINNQYFENITSNMWGVGVREISSEVFNKIINYAGYIKDEKKVSNFKRVTPQKISKLPLLINNVSTSTVDTFHKSRRFSKNSVENGKLGEEIVIKFLKSTISKNEFSTLKWHANENSFPGYDIEFTNSDNRKICIEVKSTISSEFSNFEVTINEWLSAEKNGNDYYFYLVTESLSFEPKIYIIENPFNLVRTGKLKIQPLNFKIERVG